MSYRDAARHRSTQRARTPLTDAAEAVSLRMLVVRRSGAVLAVSTGLIASVGLPARATGGSPALTEGTPASATTSALTSAAFSAAPAFTATAQTAAAPATVQGSTLTAPAMTKVVFDTTSFSTAPEPKPVAAPVATTSDRTSSAASRSTERKALKSSSSDDDSSSGSSASGSSVLAIAAQYVGVPYVYGGSTPSGFDCSGYTSYVFDKVGINLPRTAAAQKSAATRVSASSARPGDLVFFGTYHVGIYAGNNMMYDAPKPGKSVSKREIWTSAVTYGRVG